ncbi:MAG: hypothetical protein QXR31_06250 [Zestosphaera sp.]
MSYQLAKLKSNVSHDVANSLKTLLAVVDDYVEIRIDKDKLLMRGFDYPRYQYVEVAVVNIFFDLYNVSSNSVKVVVDINELKKHEKLLSKRTDIDINVYSDHVVLNINGNEVKLKVDKYEYIEQYDLNYKYDVHAVVKTRELRDVLEFIDESSLTRLIREFNLEVVDSPYLIVRDSNGFSEFKLMCDELWFNRAGVKQTYYTRSIVDVLKRLALISDRVTVEYSENTPLQLTSRYYRSHIKYMLAPSVH